MDKLYEFQKLPENIRQIGEPEKKGRIYFEDYVVTYMERFFGKSAEKVILIFLGKEGTGECSGCYFIYGAVELEFDFMDTEVFFSEEKWSEVLKSKKKHFPDSRILGWGMGIRMETRALKGRIAAFHKKHFPESCQICYICNLGEETKSIYSFDGLALKKKPGYMIYYGKNPQMQDYMLRGRQKESLDASYTDSVMENVRAVIKKNEEKRQGRKTMTAAAAVIVMALFAGGVLLFQSNQKMEKLEEALAVAANVDVLETSEQMTENEGKKVFKQEDKVPETPAPSIQNEDVNEAVDTHSGEKKEERKASETPAAEEKKTPETPAAKKKKDGSKTSQKTSAKKTNSGKTKKKSKQTSVKHHSYIVQKGDTLSQIVWRQYRDLSKLPLVKERNKIEDENQIKAGQRIILPIF